MYWSFLSVYNASSQRVGPIHLDKKAWFSVEISQGPKVYEKTKHANKTRKQEMSQSRDECPKRNWSSIRHIRGKLAVI